MSKKNTNTSKSKKSDPLLKQAQATTAGNIARIEAAERGESPLDADGRDAVPVIEVMSAGTPAPKVKRKGKGKKPAGAKAAPEKPAKPTKVKAPKRMSGLDAAAKVLTESKEPMNATDLVKTMADKGYWSSPNGKTPHATIYAAMVREIKEKGRDARFVKKERGLFAAAKGA